MIKVLVNNYFERFGNFDKIQDTSIGKVLDECAKRNKISVTDLCYRLIGYDGYEDAEKLFKAIVCCRKGDDVGFKEVFPDVEKSAFVKATKAVQFKPRVENEVVAAARKYYLNPELMVSADGYLVPFSTWLNQCDSLKEATESEQFKSIKLKIHRGGVPHVVGNTIYTGKLNVDDNYLIRSALHKGTPICALFFMYPSEIAILRWTKPNTYRMILECASMLDKTVADVYREIGYQVPNLMKVYDSMGVCFMQVGEMKYVYDSVRNDWKTFLQDDDDAEFAAAIAKEGMQELSLSKYLVDKSKDFSLQRGATNELHSF